MIVIRCDDCDVEVVRLEQNVHTRLGIAFALENSVNKLKDHQRIVHDDEETKFSYHLSVPGGR